MGIEPRIFGVIVEWKIEQPLIMEAAPMTYEEAITRMQEFARRENVIRVAIFKMIYAMGNETLVPKESEEV